VFKEPKECIEDLLSGRKDLLFIIWLLRSHKKGSILDRTSTFNLCWQGSVQI